MHQASPRNAKGGHHTLPSIAMISIDLYSDNKFPRGISILYKIAGYKTHQVTYMDSKILDQNTK